MLPRSYRLDCRLRVLGSARHSRCATASCVTVHHGTAEAPATVVLRDGPELRPGATGDVQLRLRRPVSALAGDRLILRLTSPQVTVAGATVTDPAPPRSRTPARTPRPSRRHLRNVPPSPSRRSPSLHARLAATPLQPPALEPGAAAAIAALVEQERAVRAGRDLAFTAEAFATARDAAVEIARGGGSVTLAQLRDRLGISRKYAQALLEAMDANGVTRRVGDARVLRRRARE